jgi:hypothetical protein
VIERVTQSTVLLCALFIQRSLMQALVQTLCATADNDHFFTLKIACAIGKFIARHKAAFAQLSQLLAQIQCVEVVSHGDTS